MKRWLCCSLVVLFFAAWAAAQATTSVRGTVTDTTGGAVAGASVTLTLISTGLTRTTQTSANGTYAVLQLAPGVYRLSVQAHGFQPWTLARLELMIDLPATRNVTLGLAQVAQDVQVQASGGTSVNTVDATLGAAFNQKQVSQLPIEGRNVVELLSLQPGVVYLPDNGNRNSGNDSRSGAVNGARSDQTNVTLDGVDVNDQNTGAAFTSVLRVTQDSVQEFRVTTSNADADAGHSSGAQAALVTRGGTNQYHGSLYEYNRNTIFSANDFFLKTSQLQSGQPNQRPKLLRNVFGASLGGPMIHNRLFFFINYEGRRDREASSEVRTVPTASMRQGNILYPDANGNTVTLTPNQLKAMDPLGIGPNAAVLQVLQGYPMPNDNSVGDGLNTAGFRFAANEARKFDTYIARLDWNLTASGSQTLFWRGNLQNDNSGGAPQFPGQPPSTHLLDDSKGFALGYTDVISPTLINSIHWGFTRQGGETAGISFSPAVNLAGIDSLQSYSRSTSHIIPVHDLLDDVSWIRGNHTFQFGGSAEFVRNERNSYQDSFSSASMTAGWLGPHSGIANKGGAMDPAMYGYAAVSPNFNAPYDNTAMTMLGLITEADAIYNYNSNGQPLALGAPVKRNYALNSYEFYGQDTWKLTQNLTLTYGLRWNLLQPPYETNGQQVGPCVLQGSTCSTVNLGQWFDKRGQLAAQGQADIQAGEISFAPNGPANGRPSFWGWDKKDFAPRIALAWAPDFGHGWLSKVFGSKGKVSIRGGYGLAYDHFGAGLVNTFDSAGSYGLSTNVSNMPEAVDVSTAPRFTGPGQLPSLLPSAPAGGFPATPDPSAFAITWGLDSGLKTPYSHLVDFSISRQLSNSSTLELTYVGRFGRRLMMQDDLAMPTNLVDPKSHMDYFTAASQLSQMAAKGVNIANVQPIPFWENMFGALAGEDPANACPGMSVPGAASATQVAYAEFACNLTNETYALFNLDLPDSQSGAGLNVPGHSYPTYRFYNNQYSSLYAWRSIGQSNYNALQVVYHVRMASGLESDFNYTLSKSIDWASAANRVGTSGGNNGAQILNSWNPSQLRGVSAFDTRHQINSNWVWQMPFGHGRRFASSAHGWKDAVIGGWQLSGLFRWTSGFPFGVDNGSTWPTNWNIEGYATLYKPIPAYHGSDNVVVNGQGQGPNAFNDPAAVLQSFRNALPGESGTRNPLRGDGYFGIDAGLAKSFPLGEGRRLQFRWDTFNLTNTTRFDVFSAGNRLDQAGNFGQYTQTLTNPRVMQLALRVEW